MRSHQQRAREAGEPALEPQDRLEIQVVGGLVEQQRVGLHHQDPRQTDAHLPAARECPDVAVHHARCEAEAGQHLARAGFELVAAELVEARLRLAVALDQRVHLAGARRIGERVLELVERVRDVRDRTGAVERRLDDALALHLADLLAEVSDRDAAIDGDPSGRPVLLRA